MKLENQLQDQPSCCIVLGYRDGQEFIGDQLNSIEQQSFKNFELHIFDDCSTQDPEIIKKPQRLQKFLSVAFENPKHRYFIKFS